jgi:threonine synthase
MQEGNTPLLHARSLGVMLGIPQLFIKDERQSPTSSFKDRQAAVTVAVLQEAGLAEAVVASTGNVAISFSAYCARAGIQLWAFLTSLVPASKMHEVAFYGTKIVKVTTTYDHAKQLAARFAEDRGMYLDRGTKSIAAVESMKTIAFEIAQQIANQKGSKGWRAPDWYVQSVSGGIGPMGVLKGFEELQEMGLIDQIPALAGIQTAGCAPMVHAWQANERDPKPVAIPSTHISTLSTGDPGRSYTLLREQMDRGNGGVFLSVTDEEAYQAMRLVAEIEGISMEPAAGVAFAGIAKLAQNGHILPNQIVVVNCSGHTMPVEKSLLGEDWARSLELPTDLLTRSPREGLLAALSELDHEHFKRVLIVDDHPPARTLLRRILQAQGDYAIQEASTGSEALEIAQSHPPDLVILDLMMPEMDGFAVLDHLKDIPSTQNTPVIVVTAKEITAPERKRLEEQLAKLMLKGDFLGDDLLREIEETLRSK